MFQTRVHGRLARLAMIGAVCFACCGCVIVPIKVAKKTRTISGQSKQQVDVSFITVGSTTRQEVLEKLAWIDSGIKDDSFFFGRWADSAWGVFAAGGGPGASSAAYQRKWNAHNMLIDFDQKGVVQQVTYFPEKDIAKVLSARVSREPSRALDLSVPITIPVSHFREGHFFYGTVTFSKNAFEFNQNEDQEKKHYFSTPPDNISGASMEKWRRASEDTAMDAIMTVHFRHKTRVGNQFSIQLNMADVMVLLRYLAQTGSGSSLQSSLEPIPRISLSIRRRHS